MSYPIPPLYAPKLNLNGGSGTTSVNHWGDPDANAIGAAFTSTVGYINTVSASNAADVLNMVDATGALTFLSSVLGHVSGDFYTGGAVQIPQVSGAVVMIAEAFFGSADLANVSAGFTTGSHPTGTFNNLRESYYALTATFNALSSTLDTSASAWNSATATFFVLSSTLNTSASNWNAGLAQLSGVAYLTSSNFTPDLGELHVTGELWVISLEPSSSHNFGNGALNVSGNWDGVHIQITPGVGANFIENWLTGNLVAYWDEGGNIATSGNFNAFGKVYASGGFDAGNSKVVNLSAGTSLGDSVEYTQWFGTSQSLAAVSQTLTATNYSALLSNDPTVTSQFTASYTGTLVRSEVWKSLAGALIKSSSYSYNSASLMSQSFVSVFDATGATIVAQLTSTYFYSGSVLVSATVSRSI